MASVVVEVGQALQQLVVAVALDTVQPPVHRLRVSHAQSMASFAAPTKEEELVDSPMVYVVRC
jgi:hypothetical protein